MCSVDIVQRTLLALQGSVLKVRQEDQDVALRVLAKQRDAIDIYRCMDLNSQKPTDLAFCRAPICSTESVKQTLLRLQG